VTPSLYTIIQPTTSHRTEMAEQFLTLFKALKGWGELNEYLFMNKINIEL